MNGISAFNKKDSLAPSLHDYLHHTLKIDMLYQVKPGDSLGKLILSYYEVGFANGSRSKFRERWVWTDENKRSFEWYTDSFINGEYMEGEIVVRLHKQD